MIPSRTKPKSLLIMLMFLSLAACTSPTVQPVVTGSTPIVDATTTYNALATPYAQQPAAGICASFDSSIVTITIKPDIPDPRCAKITPDQTLAVVNNTQDPLLVTIGKYAASVEPGEKSIFATPFGEYLAPGVHQLQVSPCCGAELWLEATK